MWLSSISKCRRSFLSLTVWSEGVIPNASSAAWIDASVCPQEQMPHILDVMCCASKTERPLSMPSKNRGASTISRRQVSSLPSLTLTTMLPCPSTRVRYSTLMVTLRSFILVQLPAQVVHIHFLYKQILGNEIL